MIVNKFSESNNSVVLTNHDKNKTTTINALDK